MHPSLETILELELNLDQLRQAGDWQTALPRIDTHLQEAFGENGNPPDHLADLCLVGMLAVQKAQLLQELTGVILINGETGELTPAMASERQQEFVGQSLNWFQIGLAACQRGIARLPEEPGSPWHRFLHHQLTEIRRGFLAISAGESASQLKNHLSLIRHLFSLLWMGSDFAGAEDLLYLLRDLEGLDEIRVTGQTFYRELLKLPDSRLEAGGLPRGEILSELKDWGLDHS